MPSALLAWLAHHQLAAWSAAAGSCLIAARILFARWDGRIRGASALTALALAGGVLWLPLLAVWLVRVRQPLTVTQRARLLQAETARLDAATERMRVARAANIAASETDLEMGKHGH
jgi:hypothetical protein